jgi:hypothetical protein
VVSVGGRSRGRAIRATLSLFFVGEQVVCTQILHTLLHALAADRRDVLSLLVYRGEELVDVGLCISFFLGTYTYIVKET